MDHVGTLGDGVSFQWVPLHVRVEGNQQAMRRWAKGQVTRGSKLCMTDQCMIYGQSWDLKGCRIGRNESRAREKGGRIGSDHQGSRGSSGTSR